MLRSQNAFQHSPIVSLLGGRIDPDRHARFAEAFGRLIQSETKFRLCVSGFKGATDKTDRSKFIPSFAFTVARAAAIGMDEDEIAQRFLTRYSKFDAADESQFLIGDSRRAKGRNVIARGLSIISESDLVCIAAGQSGTREYFNFARAMDKPVLPLPFAGGAAREIWGRFYRELAEEYGDEIRELNKWTNADFSVMGEESVESIARQCIKAMRACTRLRCLVFMPYSAEFRWVFERIILPACEIVSADAVRLDLNARIGDIGVAFANELDRANCVIAVVSKESANVFYEIGYAHACQIPVILLSEDLASGSPDADLTFYLRNHRTVWYLPKANERGEALAIQELSKLLRGLRQNPDLF